MAVAGRILAGNVATTNGATSLIVSPTGMEPGDWLIFWIVSAGGTGAHSNTAGDASRVHADLAGGSTIVTSSWKRKCAADEAGSYTFDFGGSTRRAVILCRAFFGCHPDDAVEAAPDQVTGNTVSALTVPSVDPALAGGLHVVLEASRINGGSIQAFTPPPGYFEVLEAGSAHASNANAYAAWSERLLVDGSATGAVTFAVDTADRINGASLLLKPAPEGSMAGSPQHITLTANTVGTATFDQDFEAVTVINPSTVDVYARIGPTAGSDPSISGTRSHLIPARSARRIPVHTSGNTVVRLISSGTPTVEVAGVST